MNPSGEQAEPTPGQTLAAPAAFDALLLAPESQRLEATTVAGVNAQQLVAAERSHLLADRLGVGFWQRDVNTGTLDWDPQMFRIHGRDPALGAPQHGNWIDACVHPLDRAWVADRMRQIEADWLPVSDLCFRALQPDAQGGERWVQIWGRRLSLGGQRLCFGMHLDVTEHQRQQSLLAHERERTRYAITAAEVGVWECDPDGRLCHANEVMYRQLGLEVGLETGLELGLTADPTAGQGHQPRAAADPRLLSQRARSLAHPDDWRHLQDRLRRRLASGEPFRHELPLRRSGSRPRWLALQGRALRGPDGRVCGMAGVQIDITERKQTEALQLEKQRLEQASRDKSVFMARMSHELRTPMNAVLGFTRLLEDDPLDPPSPRQRERLARISQAGDRLLALIDNLLDLARLDSDAAPQPPLPLPLAELLREAAAAVAGEAERAGVRLRLPRRVDGHTHGDRRRLVQALGHVLLLVVQRCAPGAELELQAGLEPAVEDGLRAVAALVPAAGGHDLAPAHLAAVVRIYDPALPVPGQPSLFDTLASTDDEARETGPANLHTPRAAQTQAPSESAETGFDHGLDTVFDHGLDTEPGAMADAPTPGVDLGLSLALRLVRAVDGRISTHDLDLAANAAKGPGAAPRRVHVLQLPGPARPGRSQAATEPAGKGIDQACGGLSGAEPPDSDRRDGSAPNSAPHSPPNSGQAQAPGPARPPPGLHVLCVEDNPVNLQLVREVFALRPRVRLSTAVDGGSGLAQALAEPPDLVLLDLQLPDMNGLEVLRRLRAQPTLAHCTVIALSADAMPEHIAAGRAAGFDDYWTKPIQFDRFLADIDRLAEARARR